MKKRRPRSHNRVDDALCLQRRLYASQNPTRKWLHNSRVQWLTAAIGRYCPSTSPGPAVDIGTGCGILLPALAQHFQTVIGLDIEPEFLRQVKISPANAQNIRYVAGDARNLPLRDNIAELVVCSEVLEHINNDLACLKEIHRVLKPDGLLVLSTPQPLSIMEIISGIILRRPIIPLARKIYREPVMPTGHINLISARRLGEKLDHNGFTIMERHKSGLYLPLLAEMPFQAPRKIAAALNAKLSGTMFDFLLWTQFFVARKRKSVRPHTRPEKDRI